jgi:hypothetical protein
MEFIPAMDWLGYAADRRKIFLYRRPLSCEQALTFDQDLAEPAPKTEQS